MSKEFKREPRYVVFKITDLRRYCSDFNIGSVDRVGQIISEGRAIDGKPPFNAVVIEQDWPEFELVWAMLEARMTGKPNRIEELEAMLSITDDECLKEALAKICVLEAKLADIESARKQTFDIAISHQERADKAEAELAEWQSGFRRHPTNENEVKELKEELADLKTKRRFWAEQCELREKRTKEVEAELAAMTQDRDEWKQSTIEANKRFKYAEKELTALKAQEPVAVHHGYGHYTALKPLAVDQLLYAAPVPSEKCHCKELSKFLIETESKVPFDGPVPSEKLAFGKSDNIRHLAENIMTDCGTSPAYDPLLEKIQARLWDYFDSVSQPVPEGCVLVPKEPTGEMEEIGKTVGEFRRGEDANEVYRAMIAAAPEKK